MSAKSQSQLLKSEVPLPVDEKARRKIRTPAWNELTSAQKAIVRAIRTAGPCTRDHLGQLLHQPASSVSREVSPLLETEALQSDPPGRRRRNAQLSVSPSIAHAIGVEVGVDRVRAGVVDLNGQLVGASREYVPARRDTPAFLECVQKVIRELLARGDRGRILGIGVGFADRARWNSAGVFAEESETRHGDPLAHPLRDAFGLPVCARSDAGCAALGEHRAGRLRGVVNGLYLLYSDGIGLGILSAGRVVFGEWNDAGEIGHMPLIDDGDYCSCGNIGCLETVAAKWALVKAARQIVSGGGQVGFRRASDVRTITVDELCRMAAAGDLLARNMLAKAGRAIGRALAMSASILDPSVIVFGGDLVAGDDYEPLLAAARESFQTLAAHRTPQPIQFESSSLGSDAVLIGAAELIFSELLT